MMTLSPTTQLGLKIRCQLSYDISCKSDELAIKENRMPEGNTSKTLGYR